jgi:hypothetical protein
MTNLLLGVLSAILTSQSPKAKMAVKRNAFCFALLQYANTEKSIYDKYTKVIFSSFN